MSRRKTTWARAVKRAMQRSHERAHREYRRRLEKQLAELGKLAATDDTTPGGKQGGDK